MKLRLKLIAMVALPLIVFVLQSVYHSKQLLSTIKVIEIMQKNMEAFDSASRLVHELQKERGLSSVFASGGDILKNLSEQRVMTDEKLKIFDVAVKNSIIDARIKERVIGALSGLSALRADVSPGSDASGIRKSYTVIIRLIMDVESGAANAPTSKGIGKKMTSMCILEDAKEACGVMRAVLSSILEQGRAASEQERNSLFNLRGITDTSLSSPALVISDANRKKLEELKKKQEWTETERIFWIVMNNTGSEAGSYSHKGNEYFKIITVKVNDLAELLQSELKSAGDRSRQIYLEARDELVLTAVLTIVIFIILMVSLYFLSRSIREPIFEAIRINSEIASGDVSKDVPEKLFRRSDEIGELAVAMQKTISSFRDAFSNIDKWIKTLVSSSSLLSGISSQMAEGALNASSMVQEVSESSQEMKSKTDSVALKIEHATESINSIASSIELVSRDMSDISGRADVASNVTLDAKNQAENIKSIMQGLGSAVVDIGAITGTINDISNQTSLLALNATIEAARAGEMGKGFAVVALEVKELAGQAARATEDIRNRIENVRKSADAATKDIANIDGIIKQVNSTVTEISEAISKQAAIFSSITVDIGNIHDQVQEADRFARTSSILAASQSETLSGVHQEASAISASSSEVSASAIELEKFAMQLQEIVSNFKIS